MSKKGKDKLQLLVEKRKVFGKKLKKLRKQGLLPANIFGQDIKSLAVMLPLKDFKRIFRKAGSTQIVFLQIKGGKEELPILIQNTQEHPTTGFFLHADFRQVSLKKKITTEVPVKFVGESEAVKQNKGVLLTISESLELEAMPGAIPKLIEIPLSSLKELNDEIKVKDIKISGDYSFKDNPQKVIVRIAAHKEETVESQVAAPETVEVTEEKKKEKAAEKVEEKEKGVPDQEKKQPEETKEKEK
jgi:large subunit ribosomal protein L25